MNKNQLYKGKINFYIIYIANYQYLIYILNMIITKEQIIKDIEEYLKKVNMKESKFGKIYFNDTSLIYRLRKGLDPRLSTVNKIYEVINCY